MAAICKHCRLALALRPGGLCFPCFDIPALRILYASPAKACAGRFGRGLPEPTAAEPGSEEKILVLQERASLNQQLWHPDDPVRETTSPFFAGVVLATITHLPKSLQPQAEGEW